jgi:hypothetical protein
VSRRPTDKQKAAMVAVLESWEPESCELGRTDTGLYYVRVPSRGVLERIISIDHMGETVAAAIAVPLSLSDETIPGATTCFDLYTEYLHIGLTPERQLQVQIGPRDANAAEEWVKNW